MRYKNFILPFSAQGLTEYVHDLSPARAPAIPVPV
jgi:hypothetical protein